MSIASDCGGVHISEPKKRSFEIRPVLKLDVVADEISLVEFHAIYVADNRLISQLLKELPPMPAWTSHLKRIKNGCILLQSASDPVFVELKVSLLHIFNGVNFRIGTVLVPQQKPITRRQYIWCKRYWPTAFHPNKSLERMLDGSYFTEIEKARIIEILFEAIQIGGCGPGCVIVDAEGNVVAKSGVNTQQLLRHSVMSAVAILCEIHKIDGSDVLQYLGTGFDVYLTDEPCCMCAMALVHFRVGRVFFHRRSPKNGAFESRWRIQEEKRLNHHYQVFRIDEIC